MPLLRLALRMKYGELADEVLLASIRAVPEKLTQSGFQFRHPNLETVLTALLRR